MNITHVIATPFTEKRTSPQIFGVTLGAVLEDGTILKVPVIWTRRDFKRQGRKAPAFMAALITNGVESLQDVIDERRAVTQ